MTDLHKDIKDAIHRGHLEGVKAHTENMTNQIEIMASTVVPYVLAFEKAGFSHTRAIKATILLVNYNEWKDE